MQHANPHAKPYSKINAEHVVFPIDLRYSFGHKLVNVVFGPKKTVFAVHEDLLCSSSKYFKRKFQKSRRAIEGDCSVCTEEVANLAAVSYCNACGQNFHQACINDWLDRERTCPLCRLEWSLPRNQSNDTVHIVIGCAWDGANFDRYMQWLYTDTLPDNGARLTELFTAHILACRLKDPRYMIASRRSIIDFVSTPEATVTHSDMEFLYRDVSMASPLRTFFLDLCIANPSLVKVVPGLPEQFLLDLTEKLLSSRPVEGRTLYQALARHLSDDEEGQGNSD